MAHKGGFTYSALKGAFDEAGFKLNYGGINTNAYELFIVSFKQEKSEEEAINIGKLFLPPSYSWKTGIRRVEKYDKNITNFENFYW